MEATCFSKHAAVVVMLELALAFDMSLLELVMVVDEGEASAASGRIKAAVKDDGGINVGKDGRHVGA